MHPVFRCFLPLSVVVARIPDFPQDSNTSGYSRTPNGWFPQECVHQVPSGTVIESLALGVLHTYPNGTRKTLAPCPRSRLAVSSPVAHYPAPVYSHPTSSGPVQRFSVKYRVPAEPLEKSEQSIYIWIGTDPDDESDVMQPVLGWNRDGGKDPHGQWYGKGGWGIESWLMVPSGHSYFSDTVYGFQPGDVVEGLIVVDPSKGRNGYKITASGSVEGRGVQTTLYAVGAKLEHIPAIQFETWKVCADDYCSQVLCDRLPQTQVEFYDAIVEPPATFYATKGRAWDLKERCAWRTTLTQSSPSSPAEWILTPPASPGPSPGKCVDYNQYCSGWAASGDCQTNYAYMKVNCRKSCGFCKGVHGVIV